MPKEFDFFTEGPKNPVHALQHEAPQTIPIALASSPLNPTPVPPYTSLLFIPCLLHVLPAAGAVDYLFFATLALPRACITCSLCVQKKNA